MENLRKFKIKNPKNIIGGKKRNVVEDDLMLVTKKPFVIEDDLM